MSVWCVFGVLALEMMEVGHELRTKPLVVCAAETEAEQQELAKAFGGPQPALSGGRQPAASLHAAHALPSPHQGGGQPVRVIQ